jgi:CheY-like chemotaxis protein
VLTTPDMGPILIVDDDPSSAEIVADLFELSGYRARAVTTAEQALQFLQQEGARVVVADYRFTHAGADAMNGLELARRVKRDFPNTVFVMVSGSPPDEAASVCDAVFVKPADFEVLATALARLGVLPQSAPAG